MSVKTLRVAYTLLFVSLVLFLPQDLNGAWGPATPDLTSTLLYSEASVVIAEYRDSPAPGRQRYVVLRSLRGKLSAGNLVEFQDKNLDEFYRQHRVPEVLWVSERDGRVHVSKGTRKLRDDSAFLYSRPLLPPPVEVEISATLRIASERQQIAQFELDMKQALARLMAFHSAMEEKEVERRNALLLDLVEPLPRVGGVLAAWLIDDQVQDRFARRILSVLLESDDRKRALELIARAHAWLGLGTSSFGAFWLTKAPLDETLSVRHRSAALLTFDRGVPLSHCLALLPLLTSEEVELRRLCIRAFGQRLQVDRLNRDKPSHSLDKSRPLLVPLLEAWRQESDELAKRMIEWAVADQEELEEHAPPDFPTFWIVADFRAKPVGIELHMHRDCHGDYSRDSLEVRDRPSYRTQDLLISKDGRVVYRESLGATVERFQLNTPDCRAVWSNRVSNCHLLLNKSLEPSKYEAWIEATAIHFGKIRTITSPRRPLVICAGDRTSPQ